MKIPIYAEVSFENLDQMNLNDIKKALQKARVGLTPSYIITHHLNSQELLSFMTLLEQALDELNLSERFPYPLYLISNDLTTHPRFYIEKNIESLPIHFFQKVKRLKPKEELLLSKVIFTSEKIGNLDVLMKLDFLQKHANLNRELSSLCHELNNYEIILEQLKKSDEDLL